MSLDNPFEGIPDDIKVPAEIADILERWVAEHFRLIENAHADIIEQREFLKEDAKKLDEMWQSFNSSVQQAAGLIDITTIKEKMRQRETIH